MLRSLQFPAIVRQLGLSRNRAASGTPIISKTPAPPHKNVTINTLQSRKKTGKKISMVTAYNYPSAVHVDKAGIDIVLVGDSVGMVELGYDTTLPVTLDMMIYHCTAVARGCHRPLILADLPFGSFEASKEQAISSAVRLLKEGKVDAVKIEGGAKRSKLVEAVVDAGVAVMGHIGLTPQSVSALGGFRAHGKSASQAIQVVQDALALEKAGVFAILIECVPSEVAMVVTESVGIPTIGIGSGKHCDGQVLVYHDLLGMMQHYHHAEFTPSFCKQYAVVGHEIQNGLAQYKQEVEEGIFPNTKFSPYQISEKELVLFKEQLNKLKKKDETKVVNDEEDIKVY